jgi:hypothetical protein
MKTGYIKITENDKCEFVVEAQLINNTLWISEWEMAALFNVYTKTIESILQSIFKAGLLKENEVSKNHANKNKKSELVLYNLDVLIFVGFRLATYEAKAFQKWVLQAFLEQMKHEDKRSDILFVFNKTLCSGANTALN